MKELEKVLQASMEQIADALDLYSLRNKISHIQLTTRIIKGQFSAHTALGEPEFSGFKRK